MNRNAEKITITASTCTALRLRKAARRITQIYDQELQPYGLTITQFGLLGHLKSFDGISIGALAEKLIMDPTTLTRNLRPLTRRGLVALDADPKDRRGRCLRLTPDGRAAYDHGKPGWARAQRHIEDVLGEAGSTALNTSVDHMLARLAD